MALGPGVTVRLMCGWLDHSRTTCWTPTGNCRRPGQTLLYPCRSGHSGLHTRLRTVTRSGRPPAAGSRPGYDRMESKEAPTAVMVVLGTLSSMFPING
jgi:hypothetical protein